MLLHDTTITLFTRIRGTRSDPDTWKRRVIKHVKFESKIAMSAGTLGDMPSNTALLLIPDSSVPGLTYVTPEMYQAAADRDGLIAFQPDDYFCIGEQPIMEYDALCKIAECHRITAASHFDLIPHYEVIAS